MTRQHIAMSAGTAALSQTSVVSFVLKPRSQTDILTYERLYYWFTLTDVPTSTSRRQLQSNETAATVNATDASMATPAPAVLAVSSQISMALSAQEQQLADAWLARGVVPVKAQAVYDLLNSTSTPAGALDLKAMTI